MSDWNGINEANPYIWTGAAGILGRLMYHAQQVQAGKRKPFGWVLLFDLPIALGMGWGAYGICAYWGLAPEPSITAAIAGSYLGPYSIDRLFAAWAERLQRGADKTPSP